MNQHEKDDTLTLMVRVQQRFRVDFKTRTGNVDQLPAMAKAFDFSAVRALPD